MKDQVSVTEASNWRRRFVAAVYATHNKSPAIRSALSQSLQKLKNGDIGLNVGAGGTRVHPNVLNLDIAPGPNIDFCAPAEALPFESESISLVVSQETLEHVQDPFLAVKEIYRVLKPQGTFYCQLPFTIGYHPGPTDFWRFTKEGIRQLVESAGFECEEVGIAVGPATGFYRIAVEFFSVMLTIVTPALYHPVKGVMATLLYPIKWLDPLLIRAAQADRIAGGYYVIARKAA